MTKAEIKTIKEVFKFGAISQKINKVYDEIDDSKLNRNNLEEIINIKKYDVNEFMGFDLGNDYFWKLGSPHKDWAKRKYQPLKIYALEKKYGYVDSAREVVKEVEYYPEYIMTNDEYNQFITLRDFGGYEARLRHDRDKERDKELEKLGLKNATEQEILQHFGLNQK